nr:hypothetical protein [Desulfobacterales bacterium]
MSSKMSRRASLSSFLLFWGVFLSFGCAGRVWEGFPPHEVGLRLIKVPGLDDKDLTGVLYHPERGTLFVTSAQGEIAELSVEGEILHRKRITGHLRGITYDPQINLLYLAVSGGDEIWECDPDSFEIKRRFKIDRSYGGGSNFLMRDGGRIEGIAFVPDAEHPEGGTFFVVNRMGFSGLLEVEVPLRSAKQTAGSEARIIGCYDLGSTELTGIYYETRKDRFYVTSKGWNVLLTVSHSGRILRKMPMPGYAQEGITLDTDGNIFLVQWYGGLTKVDFTHTYEH